MDHVIIIRAMRQCAFYTAEVTSFTCFIVQSKREVCTQSHSTHLGSRSHPFRFVLAHASNRPTRENANPASTCPPSSSGPRSKCARIAPMLRRSCTIKPLRSVFKFFFGWRNACSMCGYPFRLLFCIRVETPTYRKPVRYIWQHPLCEIFFFWRLM